MPGILDYIDAPAQSLAGLLNKSGGGADDILNSVPGYGMRAPDAPVDPFAALDKKQKEELARKAALGIFDTAPATDIRQQPTQPAPFGALAPVTAPAAPIDNSPLSPVEQQMMAMAGKGGAPGATPQSVPLPSPRPAAAPPPALPPAIANAQASEPGQPVAASPGPSNTLADFAERAGNNIDKHTNMLFGMGAGLAGAPSIGAGLGRAFAGASAGGQLDTKQNQLNMTNTALLRAFQDAKVPSALAFAALNDPALRQKVFDNYLADRKGELKDISLPNGTKISVLHNPYTNTVTDLQGKPIDTNNVQGGAIDPNLTGEAARAAAEKSDPALLRQAQNYVTGNEMLPSGRALTNPRLKAAVDLARQIDPELTDNVSQARTAYMKDVGNTKNGVGFQVKGFQQGVEHLHTMAKAIEKYAPSSGMGSADLAHAINAVKERFGEKSDLARQIATEGQATAGEVGKLYSGQAAGGVHEREATAGRFATNKSSAPELAGSLEATADLMEGGLTSIEKNRDRVMGEHGSKLPQVQFRDADTQAKIDEIRQIAKRLRGEETAGAAVSPATSAAAAAPSAVSSKAQYDALPSGRTYVAPDGSVRTKQ
jgi:hypothetical protein